jgi:putative transposase
MKKSRFTEAQVVAILREGDSGVNVSELCRKHGISNATYYKWKSRYGGLDASDLKRLRELESENGELKRMYADLSLENNGLKALIEKKGWSHQNGGTR